MKMIGARGGIDGDGGVDVDGGKGGGCGVLRVSAGQIPGTLQSLSELPET